MAMFLMTLGDP